MIKFLLLFFVTALLSGNSIGSASAYPLTDNLAINQNVDSDDGEMEFFQYYHQRKPENRNNADTYLHQNLVIRGNVPTSG